MVPNTFSYTPYPSYPPRRFASPSLLALEPSPQKIRQSSPKYAQDVDFVAVLSEN